jgi:glycerol uptake facilitator-like aquaporin
LIILELVDRYIVAQIFGGYLASMLVYYQWRPFIHEMVAASEEALLFTPSGPAGAFALYLPPGMSLGSVFINEFVCVRTRNSAQFKAQHLISVNQSFFVGTVIWASMDPTNIVITPSLGAPCVSLS